MCGRYFFDLDSEELRELYKKIQNQAREEERLAEKIATGEIYPTNHVVTLISEENQITPTLTQWGFTGYKKGQLMINAKSETVEEKKTFSKAFKQSRCVFPMSGFYEWDSSKQKHLFSNGKVTYVAGFYRTHHSESGNQMESIIMTTSPNTSVSKVHDRMPVIIEKEDIDRFITDLDFAREYIKGGMPALKSKLVS
ncbi:MAG: SOS response-associated peptidase [Enterococcus hulanensis]